MDEPQVYFATRPEIPAAGTDLEDRWAKDATIAYEGGYIKSAYGNLAQTWNLKGLVDVCSSKDINRTSYSVSRTLTIGGDSKTVSYPAKVYKKFPRRNGSLAAGGEAYTFVTDVGQYTARVAGDVQTAIKWMCDNVDKQFGTLEVFTSRGASYGPFGQDI